MKVVIFEWNSTLAAVMASSFNHSTIQLIKDILEGGNEVRFLFDMKEDLHSQGQWNVDLKEKLGFQDYHRSIWLPVELAEPNAELRTKEATIFGELRRDNISSNDVIFIHSDATDVSVFRQRNMKTLVFPQNCSTDYIEQQQTSLAHFYQQIRQTIAEKVKLKTTARSSNMEQENRISNGSVIGAFLAIVAVGGLLTALSIVGILLAPIAAAAIAVGAFAVGVLLGGLAGKLVNKFKENNISETITQDVQRSCGSTAIVRNGMPQIAPSQQPKASCKHAFDESSSNTATANVASCEEPPAPPSHPNSAYVAPRATL